jgi:hypothetical protein
MQFLLFSIKHLQYGPMFLRAGGGKRGPGIFEQPLAFFVCVLTFRDSGLISLRSLLSWACCPPAPDLGGLAVVPPSTFVATPLSVRLNLVDAVNCPSFQTKGILPDIKLIIESRLVSSSLSPSRGLAPPLYWCHQAPTPPSRCQAEAAACHLNQRWASFPFTFSF